MASAEPTAVAPDEAVTLFRSLAGRRGAVLAVSGGADSLALLHLFHMARSHPAGAGLPAATVATVDHRLRPEAAAEAAGVAAVAARLGFSHVTLAWEGDKPSGDLQAAARDARRRLLLGAVGAAGFDTLLLAHHADDQAETFLSRLARGSGVVGLAGMAAERFEGGVLIARPLLALPKARLVATLVGLGERWIEDPSNADPRFERARLRAAMPFLDGLGLGRDRLVATAAAMARASAALDADLERLIAAAVSVHPAGWVKVAAAPVAAAQAEIRLRLFARILTAVGGGVHGPRLDGLVALDAEIGRGDGPLVHTLAGVRIERRRGALWFALEVGRRGDTVDVAPGERVSWQGRGVRLDVAPTVLQVGLLGAAGRRALTARACLDRAVLGEPAPSAAIVETAAAAFLDGRPVACPGLGFAEGGIAIAIDPPEVAARRPR